MMLIVLPDSATGADQHSAAIRKQLDWVVEATHRMFTDVIKIELAFDEVGGRAGQRHLKPEGTQR